MIRITPNCLESLSFILTILAILFKKNIPLAESNEIFKNRSV
jgi:hypothetical protein